MVLLKIHCCDIGESRSSDFYNIEVFSICEMKVGEANKILDYMKVNSKKKILQLVYEHTTTENTYQLIAEIIEDSTEIKVIKKLFKFEVEYNTCSYNFIKAVQKDIEYNNYKNVIKIISDKGHIDLSDELYDHLTECKYGEDDFKKFEESLSNVMCALLLQKYIKPNGSFEFGIIKLISTYFNTREYSNYLIDIIPELY